MPTGNYRLTSATFGMIEEQHAQYLTLTMPANTLVTVATATTFCSDKLIEVEVHGELVIMFARDLLERSVPVEGP